MKHIVSVDVYRMNGKHVASLDGFDSLSKAYNVTSAFRDRLLIVDEAVEEPLPDGAIRLENFPSWKIVCEPAMPYGDSIEVSDDDFGERIVFDYDFDYEDIII